MTLSQTGSASVRREDGRKRSSPPETLDGGCNLCPVTSFALKPPVLPPRCWRLVDASADSTISSMGKTKAGTAMTISISLTEESADRLRQLAEKNGMSQEDY